MHKTIRSYASQTSTHQTRVTDPIQIKQVLPEVGIFRGCTGGDCSSQYSFPYPNDPHERVFFIEDPQSKKQKGYVSATEVMLANRDKALYVITISGRVNSGNTELILRGLEKEKTRLGVKHIVLPIQSNLEGLINSPLIREVYESYAKKGKPEALTYQHLPIREAIESFKPASGYNQGEYDLSAKNKQGIVFKADSQSERLMTTLAQHDLGGLHPQSLENVSSSEILEFILDLHSSGRVALTDRVLKTVSAQGKITSKNLYSFLTKVATCQGENKTPVSVQHWKKALKDQLKAMAVSENFLDLHSRILYPAITQCTDSYSKEHILETAEGIAQDMKDNKDDGYWSYTPKKLKLFNLSADHKQLLDSTPPFQKIFNKFLFDLKGSDSDLKRKAYTALKVIKPSDPKTLLALIKILDDKDSESRLFAGEILTEIKSNDPAVLLALLEILRNQESSGREEAARVLGVSAQRDPRTLRALAEVLHDRRAGVRSAAQAALFNLHESWDTKRRILDCIGGWDVSPLSDEKIQELLKIMEVGSTEGH